MEQPALTIPLLGLRHTQFELNLNHLGSLVRLATSSQTVIRCVVRQISPAADYSPHLRRKPQATELGRAPLVLVYHPRSGSHVQGWNCDDDARRLTLSWCKRLVSPTTYGAILWLVSPLLVARQVYSALRLTTKAGDAIPHDLVTKFVTIARVEGRQSISEWKTLL
jgi:hypothetical protein